MESQMWLTKNIQSSQTTAIYCILCSSKALCHFHTQKLSVTCISMVPEGLFVILISLKKK